MTPALPITTVMEFPMPHTKRRWLHVVSHTDPRYGGLSAAVPALGASISSRYNIEVSLAAFCHPEEQFRPREVDTEHLSFWPRSRRAWTFDNALKSSFADAVQQADGLHIHGIWEESTAVACRLARKLGKPYILSAHGMLEPWALANKRLKKRVYTALIERENVTGAACLHALTAAEAHQYRNFGATSPIAVIPNAVQLPDDVHPDLFLGRFPALRDKRLVLFLSRLHPKKGLDLLVDAWSGVDREHPDARLVIAGPDSEGMQAKLLNEILARGLEDTIVFTGLLQGPMKWSALDAAECYVLPSHSEGLSMSLLEAMGMGLPVIATKACNMPDISTFNTGWEIDADADSLRAALRSLLSRPTEENLIAGRNGARLIRSRFSPPHVARQMTELYDFVLGGPRPRSQLFTEGSR